MKKNNVTFFGHKNHGKMETKSKFITKYTVTDDFARHSQTPAALTEKEKDAGQSLRLDSDDVGPEQEKTILEARMTDQIHQKDGRTDP
jgi:transposase, IS5 family